MRYLPHTKAECAAMLGEIGVDSIDDLFADIPAKLKTEQALKLPDPLSEPDLLAHLQALGRQNKPFSSDYPVFCGAGLYPHHTPAAVDALSLRGEFATAYTPYQPELAQGTLLAIFEYQTAVAELFGLEYANASLYDGASATAEAVLMARRLTGRNEAVFSDGLHPEYRACCETYLAGLSETDAGAAIRRVPIDQTGITCAQSVAAQVSEKTACVVVQSPNFWGVIEDYRTLATQAHAQGALVIVVCTEPVALALIEPPGALGADIAVGEGIGLASPINLGGPGVGLFAASGKKVLRHMPGRLVGQTVDSQGRPGYVLTLSTREQHIRRDKATSNICTNHGLYALRMMIHLSLLGQHGFVKLAALNRAKAEYAKARLKGSENVRLRYAQRPTFNEFAVQLKSRTAAAVIADSAHAGLCPGVDVSRFFVEQADTLLVSVTECHRKADIDRLVDLIAS